MSTVMTLAMHSTGSSATEKLGEQLGSRLKGGEVIELVSDLGGGKTTFVRGLARGMGSPDHVSSPTFTISKLYKAGELELHHLDFYRLQEPGLAEHELSELTREPDTVTVVEWGKIINHALPEERLSIHISPVGSDERSITLSYPVSLAYLVEGL